MPRFLHAADIHLDSPLLKLDAYEGAPAAEIRGATRQALIKLIDVAIDAQVDFVVIAGDLYDGNWRDQQTGLFFIAQASRLIKQGIPLYVIRGNHDAANVMTRSLPWPRNPDGSTILLSDKDCESIRLEKLGVSLHGRSFGDRAEKENLAATYPAADSGMFNVGILHTSLQEEGQHATYAPCSVNMLADKQYDYWALGHIHHRGSHHPPGASPIVFSGNTQGRSIRETGPKGCYLVDCSGANEPQLVFKPLDSVRWELLTVNVGESENLDDVQAAVQAQLRTCFHQLHEHFPEHILVVRIRLEGTTKLHGELVQHQRRLAAEIQALAIDLAGGAIWIESLRVRTAFPQKLLENLDDAPLATVLELMTALKERRWQSQFIGDSLNALNRKLPDEIPAIELDHLIDDARAELFGRLRGNSLAPYTNGSDGKR